VRGDGVVEGGQVLVGDDDRDAGVGGVVGEGDRGPTVKGGAFGGVDQHVLALEDDGQGIEDARVPGAEGGEVRVHAFISWIRSRSATSKSAASTMGTAMPACVRPVVDLLVILFRCIRCARRGTGRGRGSGGPAGRGSCVVLLDGDGGAGLIDGPVLGGGDVDDPGVVGDESPGLEGVPDGADELVEVLRPPWGCFALLPVGEMESDPQAEGPVVEAADADGLGLGRGVDGLAPCRQAFGLFDHAAPADVAFRALGRGCAGDGEGDVLGQGGSWWWAPAPVVGGRGMGRAADPRRGARLGMCGAGLDGLRCDTRPLKQRSRYLSACPFLGALPTVFRAGGVA
ncbi:hypothetical protein PIB30_107726, partial [Stylosanthes scabra]|nr:hypothetical protein [Stylosanthes scabra]